MKVVHKLATVGAVLAAAGLAGGVMATASHASQAGTSVERTRTVIGQPMTWGQSQFIPKVTCPVDAPYVLKKQYNTDNGFRNGSGVEFSDYKSGFDASVSLYSYGSVPGDDSKKVFTGLSGDPDILWNTVSYWGFGGETSFKLTLHCTSDISQAVVYPK
jgi:hypothetical protein